MAHDKQGLIDALREIATLMELAGENPFHCRAYETGARALEGIDGQPDQWIEAGTLNGVKGIGKGLLAKIEEYAATGRIAQLEELRARVPAGLLQLMNIPGMGPKKIQQLREKLGIDSLEKLEAAARSGELAGLPGFGAKTAEKILAGIEQRRSYAARHLAHAASDAAEYVTQKLKALKEVERLEVAGSLRRRRETIKDLDFVATSTAPKKVMDAFVKLPNVEKVVNHGETKSSVLLRGGIPVDLRVVEPGQFAAALNYFTGSKEHNTEMRGRARRMGYKLNEYGLFAVAPRGAGDEAHEEEALVATPHERDIYETLGLRYIEPELREGLGEIEAAERDALPGLIEEKQMRGMLHCHTRYSDGVLSVRELAEATRGLGYEYLCICDHSQSAAYAGGLKPDDLKRQWEEIDEANQELKPFMIFKGIESDILEHGELDYADALLGQFDMVVASIHSRMSMDEATMTDRVCRALEHPATRILGHPTGRLLLRREPFHVDLDRVFETAARHRVVLEINANPWRLDLDWRVIRRARAAGCRFAINPDAHAREDLNFVRYGVGIARKGWLGAEDVINTLNLRSFTKWLRDRS